MYTRRNFSWFNIPRKIERSPVCRLPICRTTRTPPKLSSGAAAAMRPRRATRSTARNTVCAPTLIKSSSSSSPPPPTPDDVTDHHASLTPQTDSASAAAGVTGNDVADESVTASVFLEREEVEKRESLIGETVVFGEGKETLIEDKGEIILGMSEIGRDSNVPVMEKAPVVAEEAASGGLVDGGSEGVSVSSGNSGKTKKIVKKVVKVVRKVVRKVPKKVAKVDDLMKADAFVSRAENAEPPSVSGGEETGVEKAGMEIEENRSRLEKQIDEGKVSSEMNENEELLNAQSKNLGGGEVFIGHLDTNRDSSMDVRTNVDLSSAEPIRVRGEEVSTENFDSNCDKSMEMSTNEDLVNAKSIRVGGETVTGEHVDSNCKENVECGSINVEVSANGCEDGGQGVKEDSESATKCEDEVGAGAYMSTEMEAVERQKRRKTEVFIGGLNKDAKEEDIREVFGELGEIVEVRLLMDRKTGKNKGYAFVRYALAGEAKRAAKQFSKVEICGKESGASLVEGSDTLYLGNIDKKWKEEDVLKLLEGAGIEKIDKVTVVKDPIKSDCNRGYAFIEFETRKCAQVALNKLQKKDAFGMNRKLKVAWAEPLAEPDEEEMLKVKTVFAEFVPLTWDEKKVREIFKKFGEIENVVLSRDMQTSKRKDYAFISYETREAAVACVDSFGSELTDDDGTKVNLKVCFAKPVSKGKHLKKDTKPHSKEANYDKPKPSHGITGSDRQVDLRSQGRQVDARIEGRQFDLRSQGRQFDPRSQPRLNTPQHHNYGVQMPSTNAELVRLLREQAARRPLHNNVNSGYVDINYSNPSLGRKRTFSSMASLSLSKCICLSSASHYSCEIFINMCQQEAGPVLRGPPHLYKETSFPDSGPSYIPLPRVGATMPSPYYPLHDGYRPELQPGARAYAPNEGKKSRWKECSVSQILTDGSWTDGIIAAHTKRSLRW
ncbi:Heterogeneous nuclear ribonucleoprotein Q-like protein [Drosera capensis]